MDRKSLLNRTVDGDFFFLFSNSLFFLSSNVSMNRMNKMNVCPLEEGREDKKKEEYSKEGGGNEKKMY